MCTKVICVTSDQVNLFGSSHTHLIQHEERDIAVAGRPLRLRIASERPCCPVPDELQPSCAGYTVGNWFSKRGVEAPIFVNMLELYGPGAKHHCVHIQPDQEPSWLPYAKDSRAPTCCSGKGLRRRCSRQDRLGREVYRSSCVSFSGMALVGRTQAERASQSLVTYTITLRGNGRVMRKGRKL